MERMAADVTGRPALPPAPPGATTGQPVGPFEVSPEGEVRQAPQNVPSPVMDVLNPDLMRRPQARPVRPLTPRPLTERPDPAQTREEVQQYVAETEARAQMVENQVAQDRVMPLEAPTVAPDAAPQTTKYEDLTPDEQIQSIRDDVQLLKEEREWAKAISTKGSRVYLPKLKIFGEIVEPTNDLSGAGRVLVEHEFIDPVNGAKIKVQRFYNSVSVSPAKPSDVIPEFPQEATPAAETQNETTPVLTTYPGKLGIAQFPGLSPAQREVEARSAAFLEENLDRLEREYLEKNLRDGVLTLGADNARALFPVYNESPESRARYSSALNSSASALVRHIWQKQLRDPNVESIVITAGGPGSGKTSSLGVLGSLDAQLRLDTVMGEYEGSRKRVQDTLDAGKDVILVYTYTPADEATRRAYDRARDEGRPVPLRIIARDHFNAIRTFLKLYEEYKDHPGISFNVVDNSGEPGEMHVVTIDFLRQIVDNSPQEQSEVEKAVREAFEDEHTRAKAAGNPLPDYLYRGFTEEEEGPGEGPPDSGEDGGGPSGAQSGEGPAAGRTGPQGVATAEKTSSPPRQIHHSRLGLVTEDPDQSGVEKGHLRVIKPDGSRSVIQHPRTTGNREAAFVRQTASSPQLSRNYRAGTNDATIIFASENQRDLYDLAAKGGKDKTSRREVGDIDGLRERLAAQLNLPKSEVMRLAREVYDDVRGQMQGVQHLEERQVADNVLPRVKPPGQYHRRLPKLTGQEDLIQFIRKLGGVDLGAMAGERRWLRESRLRQPGVLVKGGVPWDEMEVYARQHGYIRDSESLLDALERAARNEDIYGSAKEWDDQIDAKVEEIFEGQAPAQEITFAEAVKNPEFVRIYDKILSKDATDEDIEAFETEARYLYGLSDGLIRDILEDAAEIRRDATESVAGVRESAEEAESAAGQRINFLSEEDRQRPRPETRTDGKQAEDVKEPYQMTREEFDARYEGRDPSGKPFWYEVADRLPTVPKEVRDRSVPLVTGDAQGRKRLRLLAELNDARSALYSSVQDAFLSDKPYPLRVGTEAFRRFEAYLDAIEKFGKSGAPGAAEWAARARKQANEIFEQLAAGHSRRELAVDPHREAVRLALARGKDVPAEVLADYPDLATPVTGEEARLTADEMDQVAAKLGALKKRAQEEGRSLDAVIDDYLRQQGLFGQELTDRQQALLRQYARRERRKAGKAEQSALFETAPTLESELAKRQAEAQKDVESRILARRGEYKPSDLPKLHQQMKGAGIPVSRQIEILNDAGFAVRSPVDLVAAVHAIEVNEGKREGVTIRHRQHGESLVIGRFPEGEKILTLDPEGNTHVIQNPDGETGNRAVRKFDKDKLATVPVIQWADIGNLGDPFPTKKQIQKVNPKANSVTDLSEDELKAHFPEVYRRQKESEEFFDAATKESNDPEIIRAARVRLRDALTGKTATAGQSLFDGFLVTGYDLYQGAKTFAKWSAAMTKKLGPRVRPHLRRIWDAVKFAVTHQQNKNALTPRELRAASEGGFIRLDFGGGGKKGGQWRLPFDPGPKPSKIGLMTELLNLPRTMMSSADLSAVLRQGAIFTLTEPVATSKAFRAMIRAARSEAGYEQAKQELRKHPRRQLAESSGLHLGSLKDDTLLSDREEYFMSRLAGKLPWVKISERAYVTFLDRQRLEVFNKYVDELHRAGLRFRDNPDAFTDVARFVNYATGRGDLGEVGNAIAPVLNGVFFAPRYTASRFQVLYFPVNTKMSAAARKIAFRKMFEFAGVVGMTLTLAALMGADVEDDPEDADFFKIRVGNTRYDILAGFQQPMRAAYRMMKGFYNNAVGKKNERGAEPSDVASRFARSKLAPIPSYLTDWAAGKEFTGEKFDPLSGAGKRMFPLIWKDACEAWKEAGGDEILRIPGKIARGEPVQTGFKGVARVYPPAFFGVGVSDYVEGNRNSLRPRPPQARAPGAAATTTSVTALWFPVAVYRADTDPVLVGKRRDRELFAVCFNFSNLLFAQPFGGGFRPGVALRPFFQVFPIHAALRHAFQPDLAARQVPIFKEPRRPARREKNITDAELLPPDPHTAVRLGGGDVGVELCFEGGAVMIFAFSIGIY
ncbi:MAG TPA: zeta toxin family protein [Blastocatellia bacterium]|nr:zeta toxin family protein [Blastocatellia bacterium]